MRQSYAICPVIRERLQINVGIVPRDIWGLDPRYCRGNENEHDSHRRVSVSTVLVLLNTPVCNQNSAGQFGWEFGKRASVGRL